MKKHLFLLILAWLIVACNGTSKIVKDATQQCNNLMTELAKDPSSVKLSNFRTVYQTDSICILHFVFTAKNGLGVERSEDAEYIYYVGIDNVFESYNDLSQNDSIYINESTANQIKKNTFYENLDYANVLKHRVISHLNNHGRVVGDSNQEVNIAPILKTGNWELSSYENEFGESSDKKYLVLMGTGVFSNSATTNSDLTAILFVDSANVSMRLVEYNSSVVKDEMSFDLKVKQENGKISTFSLYNSSSGNIQFTNSDYFGKRYDDIINILNEEGKILCSGVMSNSYSASSYQFSFDLNGYKEAVKYLK